MVPCLTLLRLSCDVSGIAPFREDVVTEGNCAVEVLANAAEKSGYYFKVPKVLQD